MIEARIDYTYIRERYGKCIPEKLTIQNSKITPDFINKYGLKDVEEQIFLINDFK